MTDHVQKYDWEDDKSSALIVYLIEEYEQLFLPLGATVGQLFRGFRTIKKNLAPV